MNLLPPPWRRRAGDAGTVHVLAGPPAATIYHQPWWLDATTEGHWTCLTTSVRAGFAARMPTYRPQGLLTRRMSVNPPLTRMLGPVFERIEHDAPFSDDIARRLTAELAAQVPPSTSFAQVFAPESPGIFSFTQAGFRVGADFTYGIAASAWPASEVQAWRGVHPKARRQLRRASERYQVDGAVGIDEFVAFYEAAQRSEGRTMVPAIADIRALLSAALVRGNGRLLGCRTPDGRLSAAAFIAFDQRTAHLVMTARDGAAADSGAVGLLVWDAANWARASRLAFDFDGDSHFLAQFGGQPRLRWKVQRLRTSDRALRWAGLI
jgi:hypothetical protein